jgi:hypothetical protein
MVSHPFVKRLIGTIRREYLDQTLFWTATDLEEKLQLFQDYFNRQRVHSGLRDSGLVRGEDRERKVKWKLLGKRPNFPLYELDSINK